MASSRHLAKLKEGAKAWNDWRRAEHSVRPDLQGLSLTLGEKQWGETNGGPIDFSRANLRGAKLRHATLLKADLSEASLAEADLSGARLQRADLRNADLSNASLDEADLQDAMLDGADLSGADLRGARNLKQAQLAQTRGNDKTQLPSDIKAPRIWAADDGGPRRLDFFRPQEPVPEEKPVFSGMFAKAPAAPEKPAPAPVVTSATPQRTSWVSRFGKPAETAKPAVEAGGGASWITSAAAKSAERKPAIETPFTAKPADPAPAVTSLFSSMPEPRKETAPAIAGSAFLAPGANETLSSAAAPSVIAPAVEDVREPRVSLLALAAARVGRTGGALRGSAAGFASRLARLRPAKPSREEIIPPAMPVAPAGQGEARQANAEPDAIAPAAPDLSEASSRMADALASSVPADEREPGPAAARDAFMPAQDEVPDEAAAHEEDFDPRWLAQMAREAGATPVEQLIGSTRSWLRGTVGAVTGALALVNPRRAAAHFQSRRTRIPVLEALPSTPTPVEAILEPHFPRTETIALRTVDPSAGSRYALVPVAPQVARSRLRSMPVQIAAAAVFAFALVGAAVEFGGVNQFGSVTLYENLPLSGMAEAGERVPAPVAAARRRPDADQAHDAAPVAVPGASSRQARGTQVALASAEGPGVATDAHGATDAGPASAADTHQADAAKPTTFAQSSVRTHGEIATPADASDPATPLVAAPAAPARLPSVPYGVVLTPGPSAAANSPPAHEAPVPAAPEPAPAAQAPADDPAANKLSFAGQDLSALAKAKKPPATVIEYMQEPVRSTEWVTTLIKKFYLSSAPLSPAEIKSLYAEPLEHYFGEKGVPLDRIAQEKAEYYKEWPKRSYKLVPGSLKVDWVSEGVAEVSFLYDFTVSGPDKEPNKGRGRANLTLDVTEAPGRITREDGEVLGAE